ncbi:MAG: sulfatase-like hydrolase/transferase [Opitutaceae bacterium]|tara:strand:+ start:1199 stop:3289 length:2091 start_codon:yes stop_codon:yes gene_type:complete
MKRYPVLLSLLCTLIVPTFALVDTEAPRPNILFIFTDDLGYGDIGVFYQNERAAMGDRSIPHFGTPSIDTMARDGVMLTQHYCAAPVCAPSRASLLTGVTQGHADVRDNQFDKALIDTHTLGSVLQAAGYKTAAFGKWGLQGGTGDKNPARDRPMADRIAEQQTWDGFPTNRGFDYFYGYARHRDGHFHYPKEDGREIWENDEEVSAGLDMAYTTDLFAARAKQWIIEHQQSNPDQPFMAYLAHDTPHAVLHNPSTAFPDGGGLNGGLQWLGKPGRMINTAEGTYDGWMHPEFKHRTWDHDSDPTTVEQPWPDVQKRYANLVRRIDDTVGDLLQTLEDLGIADNTLVIFTSDNGPSKESYIEENYDPDFFHGFGPFDGIKRDTLEGGVREPTLARWPKHIPAGRIDATPSGHWDWMATFADLAGVAIPAASDGVSLIGSMSGAAARPASTIYTEYWNGSKSPGYDAFLPSHRGRKRGQMQAVHLDGYKGLRYNVESADDDFEIFNLNNDPQESNDLAKRPEFADLQERMKARVLQIRRPNESAPRPYDEAYVPAAAGVMPENSGWKRSIYPGSWPWLPQFQSMAAGAIDLVSEVKLPSSDRLGSYGVTFEGFVNIPTDGDYTFELEDGAGNSMVFVHDSRVIGETGSTSDSVRLAAGWQPVRVYHRESGKVLDGIGFSITDSGGNNVLKTRGAVAH